MRAKWAGVIIGVLGVALLAAPPAAAGPLGEGFYFTSGLINTPKTNHLGPRTWVIGASGFYDKWEEPLQIAVVGGNINKDVSVGFGLKEWLEAGVIMMMTDKYAGQIQLRVLKETPHRPAVSLGTLTRLDKVDSIFYLVAGKHNVSLPLLGKANLYGGIGGIIDSEVPPGAGEVRDKLQGIFLGIEKMHQLRGWRRPLTLMMESDAKNINLGLSYEFELFGGLRLNAAIVKVEKVFNDGDVGVVLAAELFRF
ncbi:hypothetical protein E3J84_00920 [Candidatus Aerophobetes bacterium]|uniref:Outer membrane protein beta-barrel domain-containing protein n=1 Tax=Aerophobetes bacterium TaxID=2030807 RepID=A0A523S480_UNCAE|nr:MAG: hypothetical protein E3J84_00920 [Candidatus Aerophobetes bacterium]